MNQCKEEEAKIQQASSNQQEGEKKKVRCRIIKTGIIIFAIILLLLLLFKCSYDTKDTNITFGIIDLPNQYEVQKIVNEAVEQEMFQVFMNTHIIVNSENKANILIQNSKKNHYSAYVEIYSGNELLYKSDTIRPGYKLEQDDLQKDLDPGTYDCKAYFHIVDSATGSEVNKIGLSVTLKKEI